MQYYGLKMLFPLTQYTAESIMDVTLHHLQRQISSDVICCAMFSYASLNVHLLKHYACKELLGFSALRQLLIRTYV